jgi:endoglycosylceramidase
LGNHPAVIGFDLFNEPYPGFSWSVNFEPDQLQPFYERLIPVLQQEAPDAYVFFEPWVFRDYFVPSFLEPMPFQKLVFFPHYYNPPMELESTYYDHFDLVNRWVDSVTREARDWGVPFAVGEYGGDTSGEGIQELLSDFNDALDAAKTGGMYWEYVKGNGGYAILNADGSEKGWILDAVCRAYPRAVAGSINYYNFDTETGRLNLQYVRDSSIEAPTELAAPSRVYPNGPDIYLSDPDHMTAAWDSEQGVVIIQDTGPNNQTRAITLLAD